MTVGGNKGTSAEIVIPVGSIHAHPYTEMIKNLSYQCEGVSVPLSHLPEETRAHIAAVLYEGHDKRTVPESGISATDTQPWRAYGCIKARNNFKEIKFGDNECTLQKNTQAQLILQHLCENGAVGPNGHYVDRNDLFEFVRVRVTKVIPEEDRERWRPINAFLPTKAKNLWPCIDAPKRQLQYRVKGLKTDISG